MKLCTLGALDPARALQLDLAFAIVILVQLIPPPGLLYALRYECMFRVCARIYHSYTHLILALGIVREPTFWEFITSKYSCTHDIGRAGYTHLIHVLDIDRSLIYVELACLR